MEVIQKLKIDKVTVSDSGTNGNNGDSATSGFGYSLIKSLPPLHEIAEVAVVELPTYLGSMSEQSNGDGVPVGKKASPEAP